MSDKVYDMEADTGPAVSSEEEIAENTPEIEVAYDDSQTIRDYSTSFNIVEQNDKPDIRNTKYRSSTESVNCAVCQQPFVEPLTTLCGHTFCKACIYECLKMSNRYETDGNGEGELSGVCPLDRTPIDSTNIHDLFPTPLVIANLIDDLKVYCLNYERGCEWEGCRWELEHHVVSDCGYTGVRCGGTRKNGKCALLVERRHLESQDGECVHRIIECDYCHQKITILHQSEHLEKECELNYQTCEICANDVIPKKNLGKHEENCSKIGHLKCPAHSIGCKWIGTNETSLEIHTQSNCQLHRLLPAFEKLENKVDKLSEENEHLQRQLHKILNSVVQGKITNLGYHEAVEEIGKYSTKDHDSLASLSYEVNRLKYDVDEKLVPFMNSARDLEHENMMNSLINDNFMMREEMNLQRVLINSLRKQTQFLLFTRRNGPMNGGATMGVMGGVGAPVHDDMGGLLDVSSRSSSEERLNLKL